MKHLHFVGIGGARLRGLARLYNDRGYQITGSDWKESKETDKLVEQGITVYIGHQASHIEGADLVIYTNAVGNENPEVIEAKKRGIAIMEGAELLGQLMREFSKGIAIAGTHGKTTTSAMTALLLTAGGLDPTVLIGGELNAFNGNHRSGTSPYMMVEADEFRKAFLHLRPAYGLITNIDWDHPDCYPSLEEVIKTFQDFVRLLPEDGAVFVWGDDPNARAMKEFYNGKFVTFGYQEEFDWYITEIQPVAPLGIKAKLYFHGEYQGELKLKVPGKHNLQNAVGAIAIARELGIDLDTIFATLADFTGVQHRFEIKGEYHGVLVVDDYAHHPSAVRNALAAARHFYRGRIWCVFQPHLFSRTKYLLHEFAQAFRDADICVLADIFPAREVDPGDISTADLVKEARQYHGDIRYVGDFDQIYAHLKENLQPGDLLITMGAGDVWKVGERLVKENK
ncbi:MAG TPA: UDP-N-acetylmuramate--L-alanine ligase [Bacillota bacterium]|nr:UDP-N-acetylmuramate--L-alanine ligase [Bacillota bacterium]